MTLKLKSMALALVMTSAVVLTMTVVQASDSDRDIKSLVKSLGVTGSKSLMHINMQMTEEESVLPPIKNQNAEIQNLMEKVAGLEEKISQRLHDDMKVQEWIMNYQKLPYKYGEYITKEQHRAGITHYQNVIKNLVRKYENQIRGYEYYINRLREQLERDSENIMMTEEESVPPAIENQTIENQNAEIQNLMAKVAGLEEKISQRRHDDMKVQALIMNDQELPYKYGEYITNEQHRAGIAHYQNVINKLVYDYEDTIGEYQVSINSMLAKIKSEDEKSLQNENEYDENQRILMGTIRVLGNAEHD